MSHKTGCVYLVGAGCGLADLITVRGQRLLGRCDAVVYDDLIDPALLALVPSGAQRLPVGKRSGRHSVPQNQTNQILVDLAQQGKLVVRLKGGDPFVFGRGGEEVQALQAAGIPYEVVPGISSAIAIPAAAGIPVTHRQISRSFHVVTAHTAGTADTLPERLDILARQEGTLVFLMGLASLPRLADGLMAAGRDAMTPAAVVSGGNAPKPCCVRGTLADIVQKTAAAGVEAPAVIVVGAVAALDLSPTMEKCLPLTGARVGITGTDSMAERLSDKLTMLGARCCRVQRTIPTPLPPDPALAELADGRSHWVVLTSANGVEVFLKHLAAARLDLRRLQSCRFAVIGAATGAALARHGIYADLCPDEFTSEGLAAALCDAVLPGQTVWLFRSAQASPVVSAALAQKGIPYRDIASYALTVDETIHPDAAQLSGLTHLVFASAGGVQAWQRRHGSLPAVSNVQYVCIGKTTAAALREAWPDAAFLTAPQISVDGIAEAICESWQEQKRTQGLREESPCK